MNSVPKMHRPTAILAAVFVVLNYAMEIIAGVQVVLSSGHWAMILSSGSWVTMMDLAVETLRVALLLVILFRGKKDVIGGVLFLTLLCRSGLKLLFNVTSALSALAMAVTNEMFYTYGIMAMLNDLVRIIFCGIAAGECFSKGKVSTSRGKLFLWLLPIFGFVCDVLMGTLVWRCSGVDTNSTVVGSLVSAIPQWIGLVLMGVSLFLPAKNTEPEM